MKATPFVGRIAPVQREDGADWRPVPLIHQQTRNLCMAAHYSALAPGACPHPPHVHPEEEILLLIDGTAEVLLADSPDDPAPRAVRMERGQFSYYPSGQHHTIRNIGPQDAIYLMFKWTRPEGQLARLRTLLGRRQEHLATGLFDQRGSIGGEAPEGLSPDLVLEGATEWLSRLHCHLTRLRPGAGYAPHKDRHDVAIILLDGQMETGGQRLSAPALAWFPEGSSHGMLNPGTGVCSYLVVEFHNRLFGNQR